MKRMLALLLILLLTSSALAQQYIAYTSIADADENERSNMELAIARIDTLSLSRGEQFSFLESVGAQTRDLGYHAAANGRGVRVTGGGVDRVASTLYLALLGLGEQIRIDERHSYGAKFAGSYLEDAYDSVLVDYASGLDFCFTSLAEQLYIEMWIAGDELCCCLDAEITGESADFMNFEGTAAARSTSAPIARSSIALEGTDALISNIELAADSVNDSVLLPGELFSFNETVGPRAERFGYRRALNGRGIKVIGGGVAQLASVLWLAIAPLDCIAVVEKSTYGGRYNQSYVLSSNDAILTDYNAGTDFSFRNIGEDTIIIHTFIEDDTLYCELYAS